MKKFYAVIGNPPYQEENKDNGRQPPIYPAFMDGAYEVGEKVELITPARFLFNAGQTPKSWNTKMLNDPHLKVSEYISDAGTVFPDTDIKGGVSITYHDESKVCGPVGVFTTYEVLNAILSKVLQTQFTGLDTIVASQGLYKFTSLFIKENADDEVVSSLMNSGTRNKIISSAVERMTNFFHENKLPGDAKILARINGRREYRYVKREYITDSIYLNQYKVLIPEANNSGKYGETLAECLIGEPGTASADTFLNVGPFETNEEAVNFTRYYRTKFFRALLGARKVTQHSPAIVWQPIPLQDFTDKSDIDWSKPVADIDRQLYRKYGLDDEEIAFIESHVKEMK